MKSLATLSEIKQFFGYADSKEFKSDWEKLDKEDKKEIRILVVQS